MLGIVLWEELLLIYQPQYAYLYIYVCVHFFSFLVLLTVIIIKQFLSIKTLHLIHGSASGPMQRANLFPSKSTKLSRVSLQRL